MSNSQRLKGQRGERQVASIIHEHLGIRLKRNLSQTQNGGHDLVDETGDDFPWAIEVKDHATVTNGLVNDWWEQTLRQANHVAKLPVLVYKHGRGPQAWKAMMDATHVAPHLFPKDGNTFTMALTTWCQIAREKL